MFQLEFYGPVMVISSQSVNLHLNRLSPQSNFISTCSQTFDSDRQMPFLNQQKEGAFVRSIDE